MVAFKVNREKCLQLWVWSRKYKNIASILFLTIIIELFSRWLTTIWLLIIFKLLRLSFRSFISSTFYILIKNQELLAPSEVVKFTGLWRQYYHILEIRIPKRIRKKVVKKVIFIHKEKVLIWYFLRSSPEYCIQV